MQPMPYFRYDDAVIHSSGRAVARSTKSRVIDLIVGVPASRITIVSSFLRCACTACTPCAPPSPNP